LTVLEDAMRDAAGAVDAELAVLIPEADNAQRRLHEAMRYSALGGGKRLRPFLLLECAGLFAVDRRRALRAAAAVEMVHCYSLIHDDLPAMDDDDLRRGRPTNHRRFDEATAILAGDGLLTLAFEVLAAEETDPDPEVRCALVAALGRAAGMAGMVGGQMIDLAAERRDLDLAQITELQQLKTGALIGFSCTAGAILGRAGPAPSQALADYAHDLGLAFQIADDLLDVEGDADSVGKGVGKDATAGKATFVSVLGVAGARAEAERLVAAAIARLDPFGTGAARLRDVARFVIARDH
jgi:farnesyl diphosphate synthase